MADSEIVVVRETDSVTVAVQSEAVVAIHEPDVVTVDSQLLDTVVVQEPEIVVVAVDAQGPPGLSAYQLARGNGFAGTEAEWLASLAAQPAEIAFDVDLVAIYNLFT